MADPEMGVDVVAGARERDAGTEAPDDGVGEGVAMIDKRFRQVEKRIERIDAKIEQKVGFLFFTTHKFSQQELLQSNEFTQIDMITRDIGQKIRGWRYQLKLTTAISRRYVEGRMQIDDRMEDLLQHIKHRKPTFWEELLRTVEVVADKLRTNMPPLFVNWIDDVMTRYLPRYWPQGLLTHMVLRIAAPTR